jgi:hypothetical protein
MYNMDDGGSSYDMPVLMVGSQILELKFGTATTPVKT